MKELDLLKNHWKKSTVGFEQVSENEIYKMIHKNSSSLVKWLFIISLIDFAFWSIVLMVQSDEKYTAKLQKYGVEELFYWINAANYVVIIGFIYLFYKKYRSISATDSTHQLMQNIINTRKAVKYYIWYNYTILVISFIISLEVAFTYEKSSFFESRILSILLQFGLVSLIFWLIYWLIYGILLKKLYRNYKELSQIE
jgi:hypothetical protein